ncbi:MAG: peptide chain release factor N(5)-glutamine methyltransferase [Desulfocurvibacter africanus]
MNPSLRGLIHEISACLSEQGVDAPRLSAQVLAAFVLGCTRMDLLLHSERELSAAEVERIRVLARRRARGEPLAYIIGQREFYGLEFIVRPGVLIPRPETEGIVEEVRRLYDPDSCLRFADLGTGSGALGVTMGVVFPRARGLLVDTSDVALRTARENALRHKVDSRVSAVKGDFMSALFRPRSLECIISNPPYIGESDLAEVEPAVLAWEPRSALIAGRSGLEAYPALAVRAWDALLPGGHMLLEMGWSQGSHLVRILRDVGFCSIRVLQDLAGHDRIVAAVKPGGAT